MSAAILKTELHINIWLINIFNNGEIRATVKIHAGADEKQKIMK